MKQQLRELVKKYTTKINDPAIDPREKAALELVVVDIEKILFEWAL